MLVVGAGPAGCAAAYDLAESGVSVRLLDREDFPRPKPCAGALSVKALKRLRYSAAPVIQWVARDIDISLSRAHDRRLRSRHPVVAMTVRQALDAFCLARTLERGAMFQRIDDLAEVAEDDAGVSLRLASGQSLRAAFVIGADGAGSRVARLIGERLAGRALAIEGHVRRSAAPGKHAMRFDFGLVRGGYGWIFPKHDHLNVGLYTQAADVPLRKGDLVAYALQALGTDAVAQMVGYPLGVGGRAYRPRSRRVLLAGDAAGMAEPMMGEGLHNAIKTGQLAAAAILTELRDGHSARDLYRRSLREVQRDLHACAGAAHWVYEVPKIGYRALASRPGRTALMRGFAAGKTFDEIWRSAAWAPFYAIAPVEAVEAFEAGAAGQEE